MLDSSPEHHHESDYPLFQEAVRNCFARYAETTLFATSARNLFDVYLERIPEEHRQAHNCSACRRFINRYGGLVVIDGTGTALSVMWDSTRVPVFYRPAVNALRDTVQRSPIAGPFFSSEQTWGSPDTAGRSHLSVTPPFDSVYRWDGMGPAAAMKLYQNRFVFIETALDTFSMPTIEKALAAIRYGQASPKHLAHVQWMQALQRRPKGSWGINMIWIAVATAAGSAYDPAPWRLLRHIEASKPLRPPVPIDLKALTPALERRFARLDEVKAFWRYGRKILRGNDLLNIPPAKTMSWMQFLDRGVEDFSQAVEAIDIAVPPTAYFIGLTTAANAEAPLIIKWDREEERNPFAWFVYSQPTQAGQWGLTPYKWTAIDAIVRLPSMWTVEHPEVGDGYVLIARGARDKGIKTMALYPPFIRDSLYPAIEEIQALTQHPLLGYNSASACGFDVRPGLTFPISLRVRSHGVWEMIDIDRWG